MKYFLGFLTAFALIIILIILLVGGGNDENKKTKTTTPANKTLVEYSNSGAVTRMTVDGPVNAVNEHAQLRITVGKDSVVYEKLSGYTGKAVETRKYSNNQAAYAAFLQSLAQAGFNKGDNDPAKKDERGYCPLGNRYIYELIDNGKSLQRYWATSCRKPATYQGSSSLTNQLFKNQVGDYAGRTKNFNFGLNF